MIQKATLQVLAEAAEIGLPEAATIPAAAYDPFLRSAIKKKVRDFVDDATAKVRPNTSGEHVLRVAFLIASTVPLQDPNDQRAVEQAFAQHAAPFLPPKPKTPDVPGGAYRGSPQVQAGLLEQVERPKRKSRFWPITTPLVITILLAGLGVTAFFLLPLWLPSPIEKFRKTPLGTAMGEPMTDLVVHSTSSGKSATAKDELLSAKVEKQVGPEAFKDLEQIVLLAPRAGSSGAETTDEAMAPLFGAVNGFNEHARAKNIPALFHAYGQGSAGSRNVWVTSFFVDRRETIKLGTIDVKMAWGRRLDHLNLLDSEIYKANGEDWAILSMMLLESDFVEALLTPVAKETPMGPNEYRDTDTSPEAQVARVAGKAVGNELVTQLKIQRPQALDLHVAIAQRNEIVVSLNHAGYGIKPSSAIEVAPGTVIAMNKSIEQHPSDKNLIQDFLRLNERAAYLRRHVQPAVIALGQIKEEEFIARIDAETRYGKSERKELENIHPRSRAIAAGELTLLAHRRDTPKLALWRAAKAAEGDHGAFVAMKTLFENLGLYKQDEEDPYLTKYYAALRAAYEQPNDKVQNAADAAFKKLFGDAPQNLDRQLLQ